MLDVVDEDYCNNSDDGDNDYGHSDDYGDGGDVDGDGNDGDNDYCQRSSEVKCGKLCAIATKLRRIPDASLWWWWPSWRSKVIRGQMWYTTRYGYHIWSKELLMQVQNDDDLHGGQRSNVVYYVPWLQTWSDHLWQWWPS